MLIKNKQKLKKILLILLMTLLILSVGIFYGCHSTVNVEPDVTLLPYAKVGQYYEQGIKIHANSGLFVAVGPMNDPIIMTNFNDDHFTVEYDEDTFDNTIWIRGVPKEQGMYYIHVSTGFYGGGGLHFERTFTLYAE